MTKKPKSNSPIESLQKIVKKIKKQLTPKKSAPLSKRVVRRKTFSDKDSAYTKNYPVKSPTFFKFQESKISGENANATPAPAPNDLPVSYQETKLLLLVRDPWWLFAYWEVRPEDDKRVRDEIRSKGLTADCALLRVYDVTGASVENNNGFFDIELQFFTMSWYIETGRPDREWVVELGIRTTSGAFFALVRSNRVMTPRFGVSEILDEEWLLPDERFWKLMGLSSGCLDAGSSLDIYNSMEKRLRDSLSSR